MKKHTLIVIIVLIALAALFVVGFSILSDKLVTTDSSTPTPSVVDMRPKSVEIKKENSMGPYSSISLEYPESSSSSLSEIYEYIEQVKKDFIEMVPKSPEQAEEEGVDGGGRAYVLKTVTTVYTSTSTITYKLETYNYTGGAHGGSSIATFTYDKQGSLITLESMLTSPDSLSKLSFFARAYFYKKLGEQSQKDTIDVGTEAKFDNYQSWYVTDEGITFVFQQYQIGPYTIGIQEFPMTWTEAGEVLSLF